ncbi:MAG: SGNH/GDSL hydrolase family protein [Paenibacillaceae bacterium]|nr:SGNH/GDSL hydrolase family protein [Paenibacillaceae bacterium]
MDIVNHRTPLSVTRRKLAQGKLTVGFLGGSITDARPRHNWPEPVIAWLADRYPEALIQVENAAIGATGSESAVYRVERDIMARDCDLVFVEYAVNDYGVEAGRRARTREGLLRKLLAEGKRDVVIVYTYNQPMYDDMTNGRVPQSIADFELLAGHYGIGSVWMGKHALREVQRGLMRWEEWLPDGLHPTSRGSLSYGQSVIGYLTDELDRDSAGGEWPDRLPAPLHEGAWERTEWLDLARLERQGPWVLRRWPHLEWIDQCLDTSALGARLAFSFTGRGVTLGLDFGHTAADFRYRIDGGEWTLYESDRPAWCGDSGWFVMRTLNEQLAPGEHRLELEVVHGNRDNSKGTRFQLAMVGIIL